VTGDFAQTNGCGTSLAAGTKCTISVTFTPTQTGTRTGTLTATDSANNSPQTASLTGKGNTTGLVSIAVAPANATINTGSTQQYTATGTFSDNSTYDLTKSVAWSSSAKAVATISNTAGTQGLATAVGNGTTTIKAASGTISGSTTLTVAASLVSIAVTPSGASIPAGSKQQYTATGTYSDGTTKDLTGTVGWTSSATNVATIDSAGLATGIAAGATTITATSGTVNGSTGLTVTAATLGSIKVIPANASAAAGTTQQFRAIATYSDGGTADITGAASWSSSATSVAAISNAPGTQGLATTVAAGNTTITATSGSISGSTSLTVTNATLSGIVVTPALASMPTSIMQQFTATGIFTDGSTQNVTGTVNWTSSAPTVASVSKNPGSEGLVTSIAGGSTTIAATSGSISGSTSLGVSSATLVSIAVNPANPTLAAGTNQQFTAIGTFSDNSTRDLTAYVVWSSSNTGVATVSAGGLVASITAGTGTISANLGSVTGSTSLTVSGATLVSTVVTPASGSIAPGTTQQFKAIGTFSDSTTQDITDTVHWTSSAGTLATVSNTAGGQGLATAIASGTVTINAVSGSISGSANLNITTATLSSLDVVPQSPSIPLGASQQFTAQGTFSDGTVQDVTALATWTSSDPTIAVSFIPTGTAASASAGATVITAALSGKTGSSTLTVTSGLVSIAVAPASASIFSGMTQQFTATGTYSNGTTQDLTTTVTWNSSNTAVATISNSSGSQGLATGVAAGMVTITADSGSISGTASLTVAAPSLVSISVTPTSASILAGGTQQFTATGHYSDGSAQNITTSATWSSSNTTVATVSNSAGTQGLATGIGSGTATISALSGGVTGMAALTVTGTPNVWAQDPSPLGPPVRCFVTAPSGDILACVPGVGVFVSTNGGTSWTQRAGNGLKDVEVDALLFAGSTLLAGTHDGVYSSTDEGATWAKSSTGLPTIYGSTVTVFRLASFGATIYAGTDSGLYISQNGGVNWTASGKLPNIHVRGLAVDSAGTIYAGLNDGADGGSPSQNGSLWISHDGGTTWTWGGFTAWSVRSICVNGQTIFAGSWRTPYINGGLEESYDGGQTWTLALSGYSPNEIAMINGTLYVATRESQLFASADNGKTFQQLSPGSGAQFAISSASAGLLLGSNGIYSSADSGNTWAHQNLSSPSQVAQFLYASDGTIYARSMLFGISKSTDNGATWTSINNGAPVYQQRGIHANWMLFNAQGDLLHEIDNSLWRYQNGAWTQSTVRSSTYLNGIILLPDGEVLVADANNCVFRSSDGGSTFGSCTHINTGTGGGVVFEFALDSNNVLYAAQDGTGAWESTDLGYTWTFIGAGPTLAMGNMYSIVPFNGTVFIAKAGSSKGVVFRYLGSSNWTRSDSGIGSTVVYQLLVTPSGKLLAIGDLEIDVSSDGQTWTKLSTGMPRFTNPYYDDVSPMQKPAIGPDGKVHVGISYGGYGSYSALVQ